MKDKSYLSLRYEGQALFVALLCYEGRARRKKVKWAQASLKLRRASGDQAESALP